MVSGNGEWGMMSGEWGVGIVSGDGEWEWRGGNDEWE